MAKRTKFISRALALGRAKGNEIVQFRVKALKSRTEALARRAAPPQKLKSTPRPNIAKTVMASVGSSGVLVAEGDSWFDYPWTDILRLLEDTHGYDVESVSHKGDRVEEMAYSGGQLEELSRRLEKLLRNGLMPKAILLSGGGNDIAGPEFGTLLNHAASADPGLNEQVVSGLIDERIRFAFITILAAITQICQKWLQRPLPIITHGYDYPVPDGRGFLGGWWFLPGPWLEPGFREKGFEDIAIRKTIARQLIDRFNKMMAEVAKLPDFNHVTYLDLRATLSSGADYKKSWENELHPTIRGFETVTGRFVHLLDRLP